MSLETVPFNDSGQSDEKIGSLDLYSAFSRLNTNHHGLDTIEAEYRLKHHGPNSISIDRTLDIGVLLKENFFHTMALLLWIGGIAGFMAGMPEIAIAIWLVNIINGSFSIMQEYKAFRATAALKSLLPEETTVIREKIETRILSINVVPGDIILLFEGDKIPADARLIESEKLVVDESTLTGESRPIFKSIEKDNIIWAGTSIISGHACVLAFATGHNTRFGKIAHLTQTIKERPSPLQIEMNRVAKIVSILACCIGILMFILAYTLAGTAPAQAFIFAMGMIVAFVPEGMVPTVTLSLALAVKRMAERQALVKRLSSVEALGCANVICTDKTGTLTENKISVVEAWTPDGGLCLEEMKTSQHLEPQGNLLKLFQAAVLCSNAHKNGGLFIGDPTETAILQAGEKLGLDISSLLFDFPRIHEEPFDSKRKMMSTGHKNSTGTYLKVKGSPELLLGKCSHFFKNGLPIEMQTEEKDLIEKKILHFAGQGLRLIGVAERNAEKDFSESDLTFIGLLAMQDPPRKEVAPALQRCLEAGVRVVMITGDHEVTAKAIAVKIGMVSQNAEAISGSQLDSMTDQELVEVLRKEVLFTRVNPEHKFKIVTAFQKLGKIVAVTGDGVNDGPALKQADIGVAMGKSGTDVAREASDMILLDDNFASIVNAIEEGRTVYENIKKFAVYVFNSNMAEAVPFVVMLFSCGSIPLPLTVMQVLSIDLGTDMVPAIALGADSSQQGIMSVPPRPRELPLLSPQLLGKALLWYGLIEAIAGMSCYFYANWISGWPGVPLAVQGTPEWTRATTMTLTGVVACQIAAVFCCRTKTRSIFEAGLFTNRLIWLGIATEIALLISLMYVPLLQKIFNTTPLSGQEILFALSWIPLMICLDETRKWCLRQRFTRLKVCNQSKG